MEVRAIAKSVRMSPRKVRLVADAVRSLTIDQAFQVLDATQKRSAAPILKTLQSAVANAVINNNLDQKNLFISSISVNEGQALKRFHPSSRGRVHPYKKKSSHITIVLKEKAVKVVSAAKAAKEDAKTEKNDEKETEFVKKASKGGKK